MTEQTETANLLRALRQLIAYAKETGTVPDA